MISVLRLGGQPSHRPRRDSAPAVMIEFSRLKPPSGNAAFGVEARHHFRRSSVTLSRLELEQQQAAEPVHASAQSHTGRLTAGCIFAPHTWALPDRTCGAP